jgi:putative Ca2+/H+ antiporter (TMEM165/GDT1 family)
MVPKEAAEPVTMTTKQQMVLFMKAFTLTFVAEWGDRSQIATIALAADKNPFGVVSGSCFIFALSPTLNDAFSQIGGGWDYRSLHVHGLSSRWWQSALL